ncbi:MAG: hypothetical protein ABEJ23_03135 [Haloarculaceae archaeon]
MTAPGRDRLDADEALALLDDRRLAALAEDLVAATEPLTAADLAAANPDQDRRDVEDRLARLLGAGVIESAGATGYRVAPAAADLLDDDRDDAADDDRDDVPAVPTPDEAADPRPSPSRLHRALVDALANRQRKPAMDSYIRRHGVRQFAAVVYQAYRVEKGATSETDAAAELDVDVAVVSETREFVADHDDD